VNQPRVFDNELPLPDGALRRKEKSLLGFDARYQRIRDQLRLLLSLDELEAWNRKFHGGKLSMSDLIAEQYPLVIFHGDVGTGKTAAAECMANRMVTEAGAEDSILFKLSNRVRGSGKVGEMGTLLSEAFHRIAQSAGKSRRAIVIVDEGDSLATNRSEGNSHHEDKVAVNTLIQCIDDLRRFGGRVVVFLCTNRASVLDPAVRRRAAIIEEFARPDDEERRALFAMDLAGLGLSSAQIARLVAETRAKGGLPQFTYSDIRTRLYPTAIALAFPGRSLTFADLETALQTVKASPRLEDK
jgi:AAA+ superfamily predicted ATPase